MGERGRGQEKRLRASSWAASPIPGEVGSIVGLFGGDAVGCVGASVHCILAPPELARRLQPRVAASKTLMGDVPPPPVRCAAR